ncbi:MAG: fluoride efflux transporter CrcB [Candidatus Omnitrophica bacterium]|nr:fluoride efflux transporter CrcB [Candidatus Omnitrophota bacterium]
MNKVINVFIVGFGGFLGAIFRYLGGGIIQSISKNYEFPYGTLIVNLLGCFLIGLLGGYSDNMDMFSSKTRLFLFIGILGGFTTFSTFGYETIILLRDRAIVGALINISMHFILGLLFVYLGYSLSMR